MKKTNRITAAFAAFTVFAALVAVAASDGTIQGDRQLRPTPGRETIDIAGEWRLALDRQDVGQTQEWWKREFSDPIRLPGSLQEQGYGDTLTAETDWMSGLHDSLWYLRDEFAAYTKPGAVKVPFWLNPKRTYKGAAWYQRQITIPANWRGRRVVVSFERVHWGGKVWLNDWLIGEYDTMAAAQQFDLGVVEPGNYKLSVRVDNRLLVNVRPDSHSVTDSTQTNWNGIIGRMELVATSPVYIDDAQIYPDIETKAARIEVTVSNAGGTAGQGTLIAGEVSVPVNWDADGTVTASLEVKLPESTPLWDEFHTGVQRMTVQLRGDKADDVRELTYGLRRIEGKQARFYLNNKPVFFRGTNEGCQFPLTGYPPMDVESWRKVFVVLKDYGLNHMRFHSFCPPEAAFTAADEMGIYLQPEASNWGQFQDPNMAPFLERETRAIIKAYGNHPSFLMMSSGNEGGGGYQGPVGAWIDRWAERDKRRMWAGTTGRPVIRGGELGETRTYTIGYPRGTGAWHGRDFNSQVVKNTVPIISHEVGQWDAYPTYENFDAYTGFLNPGNYEIYRDSLAANGMLDQAHDFTMASGMLQLRSYKEEIEELMRTSGMGGFQLLDLHDYPGQGTAVVGVLDTFWKSKGYVTSEQWRRFCSPVVPLARVTKWIYSPEETFSASVEIANYGPEQIARAKPVWRIVANDGTIAASGRLPVIDVPLGNGTQLGTVEYNLASMAAPAHYRLIVGLEGRPEVENDWDFWIYPQQAATETPSDVTIVRTFTEAQQRLAEGGRVLLLPGEEELSWTSPPVSRTLVFWNIIMNPKWTRSLGLLIRKDHPALAFFPTDYYYDWQWDDVITNGTRGLQIGTLPTELKPIVQPIDDQTRNWRTSLLLEARVGAGRLMICTMDIQNNLDRRPVTRQLLHSVLAYMGSDKFKPEVSITVEQLAGLAFDNRLMAKLGAEVTGGGNGRTLIDGNPNTDWTSDSPAGGRGFGMRGAPGAAAQMPSPQTRSMNYPHEITITFNKLVPMRGLLVMNRQNSRQRDGDIRKYEVQVSDDGQEWRTVFSGELKSSWNPQRVDFGETVTTQRLKFRALSGYGQSRSAALAELTVLYEGQ